MNIEDYCFVVQGASNQMVEMDVRPHDNAAKEQYLKVWQKLSLAIEGHNKIAGVSAHPAWTKWKPGEWCDQKNGYEGRQKFVAWIGKNLAGFLNVWTEFQSAFDDSTRVLYIEHLAAFPGNLNTELWSRRFQHVGTALLAYSVFLSNQAGTSGLVGLHVANDGALGFYRTVNKQYEGALFRPETTKIAGPTIRGEDDRPKIYLETTDQGAARLLEDYHRG